MAITLSSLAASSLARSQAGGRSGVDPAAQAFQKADKRIQQQRELAAVQLSSFGKVKSAFADVQTARSAAAQPGAAVEGGRARTAETDLRRSVGTDAALADLRRIGITQQPNGTLAIDTKAFDAALGTDSAAVRSALSSVGQQVELAAAAQLADGGNVGKSVNALSERARSLETRQADQQALAAAARQTVSAQANRFSDSLNSGAAAYQRVFSL